MIEIEAKYKIILPQKIHVKYIEEHCDQYGKCIGFRIEFFDLKDMELIVVKKTKN